MATFMAALLGCSAIDDRVTAPIKDTLSEKYGKSFTAAAIGDRIDRDTATAYVYADDDPTMRFIVRADKSGKVVYEEYPYRLMCRNVENKINEAFENHGINSECYVTFTPRKNLSVSTDMTIDEFVEVNSPESVLASIIVSSDDNLTGDNILNIYAEICDCLGDVVFASGVYILTESDFNAVKEKIQLEVSSFDRHKLKEYGAGGDIKELLIKASGGKASLTASEIDIELKKE